jgi:hypothetical protein
MESKLGEDFCPQCSPLANSPEEIAFSFGYEAYFNGLVRSENPHDKDNNSELYDL